MLGRHQRVDPGFHHGPLPSIFTKMWTITFIDENVAYVMLSDIMYISTIALALT